MKTTKAFLTNYLINIVLFAIVGLAGINASAQTLNCGGIGGTIRSQNVTISQHGGGTALQAKIFAPNASLQTAPCPAIAILPGGGGSPISTVEWAAQRLAANGYIVIAVKPELPNSVNSYDNAARSGIDYVVSASNPYLSSTNTNQIGVAGWSLGAFALSITQEQDTRVKAYVGWDNLVLSETGDAGTANCIGAPTTTRTPRVPAMGQASDTCNDGRPADAKKTAFEHWKAAGQPTMEVVFRNASHFDWSDTGTETQHDLFNYYTQNWFDRWLKQDPTAASRLVSRSVNATPIGSLLSSTFRSAAFFDRYNCGDFAAACAAAITNNAKTAGVFRPSNGITYMRNSNTGGFADINMVYGVAGDQSFAGDWNGDHIDSIGIYRNGVFYLRNSNTTGPADVVFAFGSPGDQPVAGDWNGDGIDTIGVYRPTTGVFMLRNSNTTGAPDVTFVLGNPGDVAIAGDWNGDGVTTTGVFRPTNGIVYLKNTNVSGNADINLVYGVAGDKPVAGDWDGDGIDSIGIYRDGVFYLRNSNTQGVADIVFALGNPGDEPIAGDWDGQP